MYDKEVNDLLAGKYSKQTLEKVHAQWNKIIKIGGTVTLTPPDYNTAMKVKTVLEKIFHGTVQLKYASETLCALQYCAYHHSYLDGKLLLDAIIAQKRIYFKNYTIEYR